jgi:hypothetical protein
VPEIYCPKAGYVQNSTQQQIANFNVAGSGTLAANAVIKNRWKTTNCGLVVCGNLPEKN